MSLPGLVHRAVQADRPSTGSFRGALLREPGIQTHSYRVSSYPIQAAVRWHSWNPGSARGGPGMTATLARTYSTSEELALKPAEIAEFLHALALHFGAVDIALAVDADEVEVVELAELMADAAE